MLDKFLSLFRSQVSQAVTHGADDGLNEADIAARVQAAVEQGVKDALGSLHELLSDSPRQWQTPSNRVAKALRKPETNGELPAKRTRRGRKATARS